MGRSVDYLRRAQHVAYFEWPYWEDDDGEQHYDDGHEVIQDIRNVVMERFPEFYVEDKWDGRETRIILSGYGTEIGLSEYFALATLSIRVEDDTADDVDKVEKWIDENWPSISEYYDTYRKVGAFSNGEVIFEKK